MPRYLLFSVACLLLALLRPLSAASGYAGEFMALGAGARGLALGSAYVAIADDATAGYWNPAGLATIESRQLHLMHAERFSGLVDHDYVAIARPGRRLHGLAFGLMRVGVDDIPFTRLQDPGRPLGPDNRPLVASTATSADYALYLSGGHRLRPRLAVGASLKMIYRSVGSFSAYGFGLDLGLRYRLTSGLSLAANLRDVTTTPVVWDTDTTDRIQPSVLVGIAYTTALVGGTATALVASRAGGEASGADDTQPLNAGIEYWHRGLALRAGLEETRQAFGIGLRPHRRISLDLAYLQHDELETTYQFSATFHF
jgi:hypothetical protein